MDNKFSYETTLGEILFTLIHQARAANELGKDRVTSASFIKHLEQKQKTFDQALQLRTQVS